MRLTLIEFMERGVPMAFGAIAEMDRDTRQLPQIDDLRTAFVAYNKAQKPTLDHVTNWAALKWSAVIFYLAFMLAALRGFVLRIRERHNRDFVQAFAEDWQLFIPFLAMWPIGLFCYVGDGREAAFLKQRAENRQELAEEKVQDYSKIFSLVKTVMQNSFRGPQLQKAFMTSVALCCLIVLTPAIATYAEELIDPSKDQLVFFYTDSGTGEDSLSLRYNKTWLKSGWVACGSTSLLPEAKAGKIGFGKNTSFFKLAWEPRLMTSWDHTKGNWEFIGIDPELSFASGWPAKYGDLFFYNQFNWAVTRPDHKLDYVGWFTDTSIRWGAGDWWFGPHISGYIPESGHHLLSAGPSLKFKATKRWSITFSCLKDLFEDPTGDYKIMIINSWKPKWINRY
ncbi:hypothetical protein ACFL1U_01475 [Patescibacteria group bacterium]